jgi:hypothetical protein
LRSAFNGSSYTIGGSGIVLTGTLSSSGFNNVVNLPLTLQANPATVSVSGSLTMGGGLEVQAMQ